MGDAGLDWNQEVGETGSWGGGGVGKLSGHILERIKNLTRELLGGKENNLECQIC